MFNLLSVDFIAFLSVNWWAFSIIALLIVIAILLYCVVGYLRDVRNLLISIEERDNQKNQDK